MTIPTKGEILDFSPINQGGREAVPQFRRNQYDRLKKSLDKGLILALTGLRRVGKTTLIKQLLPENSFYFSFDEKRYANPDALKAVIEAFLQQADRPFIALDEVFRVEDWAGVIKRYHDQKRARFIVSGSSALMIKKGVESLSGRMVEQYVPPLQFDEFLSLSGKQAQAWRISDVFKMKDHHGEEAEEFFVKGSFPEIVHKDAKDAQDYIRSSTIERIVFEDIPAVFRVEYPSKLYDLVRLCATSSGRLFTDVGFAESLQISRHTVADYMIYLQKAYLTGVVLPTGSFQKALKKQKKVFVMSASIHNALSNEPNIGQAAETAVFDKLRSSERPTEFYSDPQKHEVDFISDVPIEVKYQSSINSSDYKNLLYFMDRHKKKDGIVVTKNLFDEKTIEGKTIRFIPLNVFLLARLS